MRTILIGCLLVLTLAITGCVGAELADLTSLENRTSSSQLTYDTHVNTSQANMEIHYPRFNIPANPEVEEKINQVIHNHLIFATKYSYQTTSNGPRLHAIFSLSQTGKVVQIEKTAQLRGSPRALNHLEYIHINIETGRVYKLNDLITTQKERDLFHQILQDRVTDMTLDITKDDQIRKLSYSILNNELTVFYGNRRISVDWKALKGAVNQESDYYKALIANIPNEEPTIDQSLVQGKDQSLATTATSGKSVTPEVTLPEPYIESLFVESSDQKLVITIHPHPQAPKSFFEGFSAAYFDDYNELRFIHPDFAEDPSYQIASIPPSRTLEKEDLIQRAYEAPTNVPHTLIYGIQFTKPIQYTLEETVDGTYKVEITPVHQAETRSKDKKKPTYVLRTKSYNRMELWDPVFTLVEWTDQLGISLSFRILVDEDGYFLPIQSFDTEEEATRQLSLLVELMGDTPGSDNPQVFIETRPDRP